MKSNFQITGRMVITLTLAALVWATTGCNQKSILAGAAERNITPPVGYEIQHYFRQSVGVHDSLYARCLYLEENEGSSVAIICLDLLYGDFNTCDQLRAEIKEKTGIENSLINFGHSHSTAALGQRGASTIPEDTGSKWNDQTLDAIVDIVREAKENATSVSLRVGRAPAQVGFNRRLINQETGHVYMGDNREGPTVPWVNVLVANSKRTRKPIAVLFEHAAHPVIVPHTSKLISADYPGAAVKRVREVLGDDVIALFGLGCSGNINGFPLRSSHEKADKAGKGLGDAVIQAIENSEPVHATTFTVKSIETSLPSASLPGEQEWEEMVAHLNENLDQMDLPDSIGEWPVGVSTSAMRTRQLKRLRELLDRGEEPPPRRFDAWAVMFGSDWCLTAMPHEPFCQYELWIDENAPFNNTMTFSMTNGGEGYIAVDEALRMGNKGGYEAARLPNWDGQVFGPHLGPPAVGCEKIIKTNLSSLWTPGNGSD